MKSNMPRRALALAIVWAFSTAVIAAEKVSRAEDREEIAVAIYNDSLALIKEVRRIAFERAGPRLRAVANNRIHGVAR